MIEYVLDAADAATGSRPIVVYSPATEPVRDAVAARADAALQDEPRGTGDALRAALAALPDEVEEVLVLSGDVPARARRTCSTALLEARALDHAAMALVAVDALDPTGLGRVVRNEGGTVERIVEDKDATDEERQITEINAGLYALDAAWLRRRIGDLEPSPTTGELYLTDLVAMAREDGRLVAALEVDDDGRLTGINDRAQLARAEWDMRVELNDRWMKAGRHDGRPVDGLPRPRRGARRGRDPRAGRGPPRRDEGRERHPDRDRLPAPRLGHRRATASSGRASSSARRWRTTSRSARSRTSGPGAHVGSRSEIGNYAEIKNSRLGEHVRQHHMSYLGDADVGADTNVGAGHDHRQLRRRRQAPHDDRRGRVPGRRHDAPRAGHAGRRLARPAPGAVVTKDVPPGKLAVGVPARIREIRPTAPSAASTATGATAPRPNPQPRRDGA